MATATMAVMDHAPAAPTVHAMESTFKLEVKVGLLLIVGIMAVVILILVSDRVSVEDEYAVTAYLPDAGGLLVGSPVTLSGIRIGSVQSIRPATGGETELGAIVAELAIKESYDLRTSSELSLATSGILGDSYLAFSGPAKEDPGAVLVKDGTAVVEAVPGFFAAITGQAEELVASANALLDADARADVHRLLKGAADLAEEGAALAKSLNAQEARLTKVLDNLDRVLTSADTAITDLSGTAKDGVERAVTVLESVEERLGQIQPGLQDAVGSAGRAFDAAESALGRVDRLLADEQGGVATVVADAGRAVASLARIVEGMEQGRGVLGQLLRSETLSRDLNNIAIDLTNAAERIADTPSVLVWGPDEETRENSRATRQNLKERRAFMEGYVVEEALEDASNEPGAGP